LEVNTKEVEARIKAEYDKLLNNETPINTATATEQGTAENPEEPGVSKFFQEERENRVRRF